jgi:hypothetical protein
MPSATETWRTRCGGRWLRSRSVQRCCRLRQRPGTEEMPLGLKGLRPSRRKAFGASRQQGRSRKGLRDRRSAGTKGRRRSRSGDARWQTDGAALDGTKRLCRCSAHLGYCGREQCGTTRRLASEEVATTTGPRFRPAGFRHNPPRSISTFLAAGLVGPMRVVRSLAPASNAR